ncbi:LysE family translocator [Comamonas composti]|uniref:LysE family translocator n=1 Tax=Comamonas composti TaxID=408558 RepID=UPI0012EBB675|nr:LysE family transporter [Comamonas composti]
MGCNTGVASILVIAGSGLSPAITYFPYAEHALVLLGSLYMLYLAYSLARASWENVGEYNEASPPGIISGVAAQYMNPKAWIVAISAFSIYVATGHTYGMTLEIFCGVFFVICFLSLWVWSIAGSYFSGMIVGIRIFNVSMAIFLA